MQEKQMNFKKIRKAIRFLVLFLAIMYIWGIFEIYLWDHKLVFNLFTYRDNDINDMKVYAAIVLLGAFYLLYDQFFIRK